MILEILSSVMFKVAMSVSVLNAKDGRELLFWNGVYCILKGSLSGYPFAAKDIISVLQTKLG